MQEQGARERRWLRFHALTAPIGVAAVTAVLAWFGQSSDESQPATLRFLNSAATKAYLATVTYALIAATAEGIARMFFWAWEDHKNRMQRIRNQVMAEGRAEGRAEAAKEYEEALAAVREREDRLRERAKAEGIDIDRLLNL